MHTRDVLWSSLLHAASTLSIFFVCFFSSRLLPSLSPDIERRGFLISLDEFHFFYWIFFQHFSLPFTKTKIYKLEDENKTSDTEKQTQSLAISASWKATLSSDLKTNFSCTNVSRLFMSRQKFVSDTEKAQDDFLRVNSIQFPYVICFQLWPKSPNMHR